MLDVLTHVCLWQINSVASLQNLGSLIIGVQSSIFNLISGNIFLEAMKSELFVTNVARAPVIVQQTIVSQVTLAHIHTAPVRLSTSRDVSLCLSLDHRCQQLVRRHHHKRS